MKSTPIDIRIQGYTPVLFYINQNSRGWWLEGYCPIDGHFECSPKYRLSLPVDFEPGAPFKASAHGRNLASVWMRIGESTPAHRVFRLVSPRNLPYIGV